ncbi:MAG: hypothetical protein M1836_007439 [Candelina mexicana]|nr:MAG: hypothetical protein M1836_007439 [Candelina mexicana]
MGTPHRGSDQTKWASIAKNLAKLLTSDTNDRIVTALSRGSDMLDGLQDSFAGIIDQFNIYSAFEEREFPKIGKIVDDASASLGVKNEDTCTIPANHLDMCKYETMREIGFRRVSGAIEELVEKAYAKYQEMRSQEDHFAASISCGPPNTQPIKTADNVDDDSDVSSNESEDSEEDDEEESEDSICSEDEEKDREPGSSPITVHMLSSLLEEYKDKVREPSAAFEKGLRRLEEATSTEMEIDYGYFMHDFDEYSSTSQELTLYLASLLGHELIVDRLLKAGVEPNSTPHFPVDEINFTPLAAAVFWSEDDTVKVLLDGGADLRMTISSTTSTEDNEDTEESISKAIELTARHGTSESTLLILKHRGQHNIPSNYGILSKTVRQGKLETLEILLNWGADIDEPEDLEDEETSLHVAAKCGYNSEAEVLLHRGADINAQSATLRTPLHLALESEDADLALVYLLLRWEANTEMEDEDGNTALHYVVADPEKQYFVQALLDYGASIKHRNKAGQTPLDQAKGLQGVSILQGERLARGFKSLFKSKD